MDTLRSILITLCIVSITAGLCRMLAPKGRLGKSIGMITGVFVLSCFLAPFSAGGTIDWDWSLSVEELTPALAEGTYVATLEQVAKEEVVTTVETIAREQNCPITAVSVDTRWQEEQVWIQSVTVTAPVSSVQASELKKQLGRSMDCEILVTCIREDEQ